MTKLCVGSIRKKIVEGDVLVLPVKHYKAHTLFSYSLGFFSCLLAFPFLPTLFSCLLVLSCTLAFLPMSTVDCERGSHIETDLHNHLSCLILNSLKVITVEGSPPDVCLMVLFLVSFQIIVFINSN